MARICPTKHRVPRSSGEFDDRVSMPLVSARRTGDRVAFRWHAADAVRAGDSYQWRLPRRGGTHLTTARAVTVPSSARVCLQVRLARPGLPPSTWASACA